MERVETGAALTALLNAQLRPGVYGNAIGKERTLRRAAEAGLLLAEERPDGLLLLRQKPEAAQLYFCLRSAEEALPLTGRTVTEIAYRERDRALRELLPRLEAQGFEAILRRLRLSSPALPEFSMPDGVREAEAADDTAILRLLEASFSPLTGCLPDAAELAESRCLLIDGPEGPAAVLHWTPGAAAEIRHLAVAASRRGEGLAQRLLEGFCHLAAGGRAVVWAGSEAHAARHIYEKYTFSPDGWQSAVLRYEPEPTAAGQAI